MIDVDLGDGLLGLFSMIAHRLSYNYWLVMG
jgi:hypothetical protein